MDKAAVVFLLVLVGSWACDARNLVVSDVSGSNGVGKRVDTCALCEEYANLAVDYLHENKTQTQIIEAFHSACSQFRTLQDQCLTLVDYYAQIFFVEVSEVQPDEFCCKVNLCKEIKTVSLPAKQNSCDVCHQAVDEIMVKLKDPDTKLEIIEILLKGCDAMENYAKKCKAMVFEYGPIILLDAQKYLEKTDICTAVHACNVPSWTEANDLNPDGKIRMVTSSA